MMFAANVIVLLALAFFMVEINQHFNGIAYIKDHPYNIIFVASAVLFLSILTYGYLFFECKELLINIAKLTELFILLDLSVMASFLLGHYLSPEARPFAFFAIMCATLLGRRIAIFSNIINSLLIFVIDLNINVDLATVSGNTMEIWQYCAGLLITFCSGMLIIFFSHKVKNRLHSVLLAFLVLIPIELIIFVMEILFALFGNVVAGDAYLLAFGALGALFSIVLYLLLLPLFELVFREITVFRLREITSPNSKLIKKLKDEAPGTYNHSVVVAQLTEACAIAIGEDGELARAAAYYHDMGKLKNPDMFTENQSDYNAHSELTPELSVEIIRSHATYGQKLIKKYHLPEFLADIAVQHHGTMPIKYFYAKALKMTDGDINMENYSYVGPAPQTRIAAIVMIADASEAASRSLSNRTPAKIQALVGSIIEERLNLDQFRDCPITMRDLTIITHTITQALTGLYHSRISYPKIKISKKS